MQSGSANENTWLYGTHPTPAFCPHLANRAQNFLNVVVPRPVHVYPIWNGWGLPDLFPKGQSLQYTIVLASVFIVVIQLQFGKQCVKTRFQRNRFESVQGSSHNFQKCEILCISVAAETSIFKVRTQLGYGNSTSVLQTPVKKQTAEDCLQSVT